MDYRERHPWRREGEPRHANYHSLTFQDVIASNADDTGFEATRTIHVEWPSKAEHNERVSISIGADDLGMSADAFASLSDGEKRAHLEEIATPLLDKLTKALLTKRAPKASKVKE